MNSCNRNILKTIANISVFGKNFEGQRGGRQGFTKRSMFESYGNAIAYQ
jgi:hypothetical protein